MDKGSSCVLNLTSSVCVSSLEPNQTLKRITLCFSTDFGTYVCIFFLSTNTFHPGPWRIFHGGTSIGGNSDSEEETLAISSMEHILNPARFWCEVKYQFQEPVLAEIAHIMFVPLDITFHFISVTSGSAPEGSLSSSGGFFFPERNRFLLKGIPFDKIAVRVLSRV